MVLCHQNSTGRRIAAGRQEADCPSHLHPEEGLALLPQVWQQAQQARAVGLDAVCEPLNDEVDQVEDLQAAIGTLAHRSR